MCSVFGAQTLEEMLRALEMCAEIDKKQQERFPLGYNYLLSGGYFVTHSARMSKAGTMGIGAAHITPYFNWNAHIQPFSHLELSANYRIFKGCLDSSIGAFGFGDYADRGANMKMAFFTPEESLYQFPGLSIGIDDFMGTKKFTNYYLVATQVMRDWGLELSLGWGTGKTYSNSPSKGIFGAACWCPLWNTSWGWFRGVCLAAELDPTNYHKDPHPKGRTSHSNVNIGLRYNYEDIIDLSVSSIRGEALAFGAALNYNWGSAIGFVPKINDPPIYCAPTVTEPLGCTRPSAVMVQELNYALKEQGFRLNHAWMTNGCSPWLFLDVRNLYYRQESCVRNRLQHVLGALLPTNIAGVTVLLESYGVLCQQYVYDRELLVRFKERLIGRYEFDLLAPREDVCFPNTPRNLVFQQNKQRCLPRLFPRFESFFGSSRGKFKYNLGLKAVAEGFLPCDLFYEAQASYTILSTLRNVSDFDFFYPSQLPNVATDYVRYRQQSSFSLDVFYLQKSWTFPCGLFGRALLGYFQVNYAGAAAEFLWYPAKKAFAVGVEGAVVKKRRYTGLGFQNKLREFEGYHPIFVPYTVLQQYFCNLYLDFCRFGFFTKFSVGQFLAGDLGARCELTRYFENGVRLTGWLTFTNAADVMHGEKYFDRGIALEVPFDLFFKKSSKRVWNYGMAAWLRDAGYAIRTGKPLFDTLNRERRW